MRSLRTLIHTTVFTLALIGGVVPVRANPLVEQQRQLVSEADAIVQAWRQGGDGDVTGRRPMIITLFTGSDTDPAPNYRQRLTRTMKHIQAFYAKEMDRHGFGPLTFPLDVKDDGLLEVHIVRGDRPSAQYNGDHGQEIKELVHKHLKDNHNIDGNRETVVIFCNLTKWDPAARRMSHHSPYYAIGSSREGTAWQLDSAILDAAELANTDRALYLRDGQYGHISLGKYQSIFVGGICHELGHALGLPHNLERADERAIWGTALMGSGNRTYGEELRDESKGSFLTIAHAMKLAVHPAFTGSTKQMWQRPNSRYTALNLEPINESKGVRLIGKIESEDIPVHAVIAYLDPEGQSDYNATTHVAVPDEEGNFTIDATAFAGQRGRVRLVRVHANGWARFSEDLGMNYTRTRAGVVSLDEPNLNRQRTDAGLDGLSPYATKPLEPCPCGAHH